jgi:hypothetical protein
LYTTNGLENVTRPGFQFFVYVEPSFDVTEQYLTALNSHEAQYHENVTRLLSSIQAYYTIFDVLTAVNMKITALWDVKPSSLVQVYLLLPDHTASHPRINVVRSDRSKPALIFFFFFFTARVHTTKSTVKILAANTHCKYF